MMAQDEGETPGHFSRDDLEWKRKNEPGEHRNDNPSVTGSGAVYKEDTSYTDTGSEDGDVTPMVRDGADVNKLDLQSDDVKQSLCYLTKARQLLRRPSRKGRKCSRVRKGSTHRMASVTFGDKFVAINKAPVHFENLDIRVKHSPMFSAMEAHWTRLLLVITATFIIVGLFLTALFVAAECQVELGFFHMLVLVLAQMVRLHAEATSLR